MPDRRNFHQHQKLKGSQETKAKRTKKPKEKKRQKMACWSAENATKAYLRTLKMVSKRKSEKQPDVAEFVSALAAGNTAQLMVEVCSGTAGATTLALVAAAHQTGGRVVCILQGPDELHFSMDALGHNANKVEFVVGDARSLLTSVYTDADFVLIDCNLDGHESVFGAIHAGSNGSGTVVVGYNAFSKASWWRGGFKTQLLPIGEGLLMTTIPSTTKVGGVGVKSCRWVSKIDECTGEEHVFMIRNRRRDHN